MTFHSGNGAVYQTHVRMSMANIHLADVRYLSQSFVSGLDVVQFRIIDARESHSADQYALAVSEPSCILELQQRQIEIIGGPVEDIKIPDDAVIPVAFNEL